MTANPIEAVIFDFDGVLVDSEPVQIEAWERYLETHGKVFDHSLLDQMLGRRIIDSAALIVSTFDLPVDVPTAAAERNATFFEIAPGRIHAMPGAQQALREFADRGVRIGLATSGIREYVELAIESAGLPPVFGAIVTAEDVQHGKPNPEVFLTTAARLGVEPRRCLVLEDAPNGVEAAKRAGMWCFGLPETDWARGQMAESDAVLDSLDEVLPALACHGLELLSSSQG